MYGSTSIGVLGIKIFQKLIIEMQMVILAEIWCHQFHNSSIHQIIFRFIITFPSVNLKVETIPNKSFRQNPKFDTNFFWFLWLVLYKSNTRLGSNHLLIYIELLIWIITFPGTFTLCDLTQFIKFKFSWVPVWGLFVVRKVQILANLFKASNRHDGRKPRHSR